MAQEDYTIDNASGASVRADINATLSAIVSLNSGASAPSTTFAYMLWADTTNGVLKRRNAANSGWLVVAPLASTMVQAKTGAYTVLLGDYGTLIDCTSGTFSLALTAAATLGDGFVFTVRNSGSGVITIDPNSSETIDGATTITLNQGETALVWCNGTSFKALRGGPTLSGDNSWTGTQSFPGSTAINSSGALAIGGGGAIKKLTQTTVSLNFPSIASGAKADLTATVTGAVVGDIALVSFGQATRGSDLWYDAWVSAADTVTVRAFNRTGSAIDASTDIFRIVVIGF